MTKPKKAPEKARVIKMALINSASNRSPAPAVITTLAPGSDKAVRILAKSLFRQLKNGGYQHRDILTLSAELVSLITTDMRPCAPAPADKKSTS